MGALSGSVRWALCPSAAPRALFGITKWQSKEGLSGNCWRKGRFEVHVLLRLFADEQVHILHVGVECGVGLPFFGPKQAQQ